MNITDETRNQTDQKYFRVSQYQISDAIKAAGELLMARNGFLEIRSVYKDDRRLLNLIRDLDQVTNSIQNKITGLRLCSLDPILRSMHSVVRTAANKLGKQINLNILSGDTYVDRTILELIKDPLMHIIRNSVDHGIETPQERKNIGKAAQGTIEIESGYQSGEIFIAIKDDGRGIDLEKIKTKVLAQKIITQDELSSLSKYEIYHLIFRPGFSTKDEVSDLSGRGVGMDVVKTQIESLQGSIGIETNPDRGTTIKLSLPLNVSIIESLFFNISHDEYSIPLNSILEVFPASSPLIRNKINDIGRGLRVVSLRGRGIPIMNLAKHLGYKSCQQGGYILVRQGNTRFMLEVDRVSGASSIFVQPIQKSYHIEGPFSGTSKSISGSPVLQIDISSIAKCLGSQRYLSKIDDNKVTGLSYSRSQRDLTRLRQKLLTFKCLEHYAIPVQHAEKIFYADSSEMKKLANGSYYIKEAEIIYPILWIESLMYQKPPIEADGYWCICVKINEEEKVIPLCEFTGIKKMGECFREASFHDQVIGSTTIDENHYLILDLRSLQRVAKDEITKPKVILFAEDEPFYRHLLTRELHYHHYEIHPVKDGKEAIDALKQWPIDKDIDLVITDIEMPNANGAELISFIRSHETFKHLPIMVVTALSDKNIIRACHDAGADMYMSKQKHNQVMSFIDKAIHQPKRKKSSLPETRQHQGKRMITFEIGNKILALDIKFVIEMNQKYPIKWVPGNSSFLDGITYYGDESIPILNLGKLLSNLGLDLGKNFETNQVVIIDIGEDYKIGTRMTRVGNVVNPNNLKIGEGLFCLDENLQGLIIQTYLDKNGSVIFEIDPRDMTKQIQRYNDDMKREGSRA